MFVPDDTTFKISTVINPTWEPREETLGIRNFHALSFRITGNAKFTYNNNSSSITVSNGDILFVPERTVYNIKCANESLIVAHFTTDTPIEHIIKKFTPSSPDYFEKLFTQLFESWSKKQAGYLHQCQSILHKILYEIEKDAQHQSRTSNTIKILRAAEYIHEHYTDSIINIHELAKMCSMSDAYFRKLFYKQFQKTPLKYINDLKIKFAIEALTSGYYSVTEVSEMCNFENVYYFSKFVKKNTGFAPSHFIVKT